MRPRMVESGKIGVLLINLGSPEGTDFWSVRRYLKEFLGDRRVVEIPRPIWWLILNGIILNTRPQKSGKKYEEVWDKKNGLAPLISITMDTSEKLAAHLSGDELLIVDWAMRYGKPSIASKIEYLMERGCERILLFPLYPQYSASTTATVIDAAADALKKIRHQPALRSVPPYYGEPSYIEALSASLVFELKQLDFIPDVIITSFHGLPQLFADRGDPYPLHCEQTFKLLKKKLGADGYKLHMTYQSRVGPANWLQPYTDKTLEKLASDGVENVVVLTPGFAADCLETLEEISIENADIFIAAGGKNFTAIPCLNDSKDAIEMMSTLIKRELQGWI
ncbi:MAG: ferrochelatase [bacterium]|nr:ferrochelatase [bacterium]